LLNGGKCVALLWSFLLKATPSLGRRAIHRYVYVSHNDRHEWVFKVTPNRQLIAVRPTPATLSFANGIVTISDPVGTATNTWAGPKARMQRLMCVLVDTSPSPQCGGFAGVNDLGTYY
jgi:hypothetical protein